jgi:hypothetical protein
MRLFFRNIFLIVFFVAIFTADGFSALRVFPDAIRNKAMFLSIVLENAVSGSKIFKDFTNANHIENISLRYLFFPAELLKRKYNTEQGFSSNFVDDASQGFPSEKDSLRLLEIIYEDYRTDMDKLSEHFFPKIIEFVPNNAACFRYLSAFDARDHVPINVPGLYCISAVYKNSHHADPELLQSLLENSLKFKAQKKHLFCGDKERLIDKIFQEGLIKSSLFKNFILGNAIENISFSFNFQSVEDLTDTLRDTKIKKEVIENLVNDPESTIHHEFFAKEACSLFKPYRTSFIDLLCQTRHSKMKNRPLNIKIDGLVEVLIDTEHLREILNDDQGIEKGVYFISAALLIDPNENLSNLYVPNYQDPLMQEFPGNKNALIKTINSSGISRSSIFQMFTERNTLENIAFTFVFISKNILENIFPCGAKNCACEQEECPSIDDFVLGNFTQSNRRFLRKELNFVYYADLEVSKNSRYSNTKKSPFIAELLNKNPDTTRMLTCGCKDLESEQGIYLVNAFFVGDQGFYPKLEKQNWGPPHVSLTDRLFPAIDRRAQEASSSEESLETKESEG